MNDKLMDMLSSRNRHYRNIMKMFTVTIKGKESLESKILTILVGVREELACFYGDYDPEVKQFVDDSRKLLSPSKQINKDNPFFVRCCDKYDNDVGFVTEDKTVTEDESKIKYFSSEKEAEDFVKLMYEFYKIDNEIYHLGYEFYVDK